MTFPVDFLAEVSHAELEQFARNYMNDLLYSNPDSPEYLTLSDSTQVPINISSVGFVPLYGSSDKQKILALFLPGDPLTAVALYLLDQWWPVDKILKTADPARDGPLKVQTVGEKIVLYLLNRVIYRAKEMSSEERPFLCHGDEDHAKILWSNREAVGFYSVKPSGISYNSFSTRSYQLPVMDSIFVRKCQRGKGFGLQMLEDFVFSFKEDCLGLRYPLTKSMYKVCDKYLCEYPGHAGLLWEVESIGLPNQRTNIARKIQAMDMTKISKSLSFTEESHVITCLTKKDVMMETHTTQIKEADSFKCSNEIVEDLTVQSDIEVSETVPVADHGRSNASKQRRMGEKLTEDKSDNIVRIEDIEAETPRQEQLHNIYELLQTESVIAEENGKDVFDTAPPEEATTMSSKQATVRASQDLEEADATLAPMYEEPQVEELNNTYHDSQITVENLASETEAATECQKENNAVLGVSEEVLKVNETFETQMEVTEMLEESVTQHEISLSSHATSQDVEAGKTGSGFKAIKTVQSEDNAGEKEVDGAETGAAEGGAVPHDDIAVMVSAEEKKSAALQTFPDGKTDIPVDAGVVENLPPSPADETVSMEDVEGPAVETRALRSGSKEVTVIARRRTTRSRKQAGEQETQNCEEEQVVTTRTQRRETASTPRGKPRRSRRLIQEEEQQECEHVKETGTEEMKEMVEEDVACEREESLAVDEGSASGEIETEVRTGEQGEPVEGTASMTEESPHAEEAAEDAVLSTDLSLELHEEITEEEEAVPVMREEETSQDKVTEEPGTVGVLDEAATPRAEEAQEQDTGVEIQSVVEEKQSAALQAFADGKTDIPVEGGAEENLPPSPADEAVSMEDEEAPVVETRALRSGSKAVTAMARSRTTRSRKQAGEQETQNCEEEQVVTTRTQRREMASTPRGKPRRSRRLIQEEEQQECEHVKETGTEEMKEMVEEDVACEREESLAVDEGSASGEIETEVRTGEQGEPVEGTASMTEESPHAEEAAEDAVLSTDLSLELHEEITEEEEAVPVMREEETSQDKVTEEPGTVGVLDEAATPRAEEAQEQDTGVEIQSVVEEKQSAALQAFADGKTDIPVEGGAEENLPPSPADEAVSMEDEEAPVVETRALRSGSKAVTAIARSRTTRSRKQAGEQETQNCEEEQVVTTRTQRREMASTPRGKPRRSRRLIQEEEQQECEHVKETGTEEMKEMVEEDVACEREESLAVDEGSASGEIETEVRTGEQGEPVEGTASMTEESPHAEEAAEDAVLSTDLSLELHEEITEEEEAVPVMREEETSQDKVTEEPGTVGVLDEAATPRAEESQEQDTGVEIQSVVEEKQSAALQAFADGKTDIPVEGGAEENLPPSPADEAVSMEDEEAPVVETRALRSGSKAVTAIARSRTTRSRKQAGEQETQNCEEEQVVTTRTQRREMASTPRGKPRRSRRLIQEEEQQECEHVKETGTEEMKEMVEEDVACEQEESLAVDEGSTAGEIETEVKTGEQGEPVEGTASMTEESPHAEEAAEDVVLSTDLILELHEEITEDEETVPVMREEETSQDKVTEEPGTVGVLDEAATPRAEEAQENDTGVEIQSVVGEACAVSEQNQMELIAPEKGEGSSCAADEHITEPELLVLREEDREKQEKDTEESVDTTGETETGKKEQEEPEEDGSDKDKEEFDSVHEEKSEADEALVIETTVLNSGRKTVGARCRSTIRSNQEQNEDNAGEKEVDGAAEGGAVPHDAALQTFADGKTDIPVEGGAEENLPPSPADEAVSMEDEEGPVVETRALRSGSKAVTAIARRRTMRGRKQAGEQETQKCEEDDKMVTTRAQRRETASTPRGKPRRSHRLIQEEEQRQCEHVKETGTEEMKEMVEEDVACEREESLAGGEGSAPGEDETAVRMGEQGEPVEGTASTTEKSTCGVTAAACDSVHGETSTLEPATDLAVPSSSAGAPQIHDLQSMIVVLMDLNKTHYKALKEPATAEGGEIVDLETEEGLGGKGEGDGGSTEAAGECAEAVAGQSAEEEERTLTDAAEEAGAVRGTVEGEQSASAVVEHVAAGSAQETAGDDPVKGVSEEEEVPVVREMRVLRSSGKKTRQITKRQADEQREESTGKESVQGNDALVEPSTVRRGRRSAAAARHKPKQASTQCDTGEEGRDESSHAGETQAQTTEAEPGEAKLKGQDGKVEAEEEAAAQKEENAEPEIEKVEAVTEECLTEREVVEEEPSAESEMCADGLADIHAQRQTQEEGEDGSPSADGADGEEKAGHEGEQPQEEDSEEKDGVSAAGGESASGDAEQTEDASTGQAAVPEKGENTGAAIGTNATESAGTEDAATVALPAAAAGCDAAIGEEEALVDAPEEAPVVTTRTLRSKTIISHGSPSQRVTKQKGQGPAGSQQKEDEEVGQLTGGSSETTEQNAPEEENAKEASPTGQEAEALQAEDPAAEEAASAGEEASQSEKDAAVNSSVFSRRTPKRKVTEDKPLKLHLPEQRSTRKKPRVDYREDDEEEYDEVDETEAASGKEEEDEVQSDEGKDMKTDEEVESVDTSQVSETDDQEAPEEAATGERVLRGRSVPSVVITPSSKGRRRSAKVQKADESLADDDKIPQSAQRRSLRKRRSTETPQTRKSKRLSKV